MDKTMMMRADNRLPATLDSLQKDIGTIQETLADLEEKIDHMNELLEGTELFTRLNPRALPVIDHSLSNRKRAIKDASDLLEENGYEVREPK